VSQVSMPKRRRRRNKWMNDHETSIAGGGAPPWEKLNINPGIWTQRMKCNAEMEDF